VQDGYGVVFAFKVQVFIEDGRVAVQCLSEPGNYHGIVILLTVLVQCRGTILIGARKLSRCIEIKWRVMARIRVQTAAGFVLGVVLAKTMTSPLIIPSVLYVV
jgi:hypothetical protein